MRVKGYLSTRGVEFVAIDVISDTASRDELNARGIKSIPVVTVGNRHALGFDLAQIDALLGLSPSRSGRQLSGNELVDRATRLLEAAGQFALQLPSSHYDDPFPGLENAKVPYMMGGRALVLSDGTPYIPHGTLLGLVRHIVHHGEKFKHALENPESEVISDIAAWSEFGEPELALDIVQIVERMATVAADIQTLWTEGPSRSLDFVRDTFIGPQNLHKILQAEVAGLASHSRQLMTKLRDFGIEPANPIGDVEYEGLQLSPQVWK